MPSKNRAYNVPDMQSCLISSAIRRRRVAPPASVFPLARASMAEFRLRPMATLDSRMPVIDLPDERPFATGNGAHDYLCGTCGHALFLKVEIVITKDVVVICGKCRSNNLMAL